VRPRTNTVAKVIDKNRLTGGKLVGSVAAFDGEQNRTVFFSPLKSTSHNRKRVFPFLIRSYNFYLNDDML